MKVEDIDPRDDDEREERRNGKTIGVYIDGHYVPDARVTFEELIELRLEIERYIFSYLQKRNER